MRHKWAAGVALLCCVAVGSAVLVQSQKASPPSIDALFTPVWKEVAWPFPADPFGRGRAFRCTSADCGEEITIYLRAKFGLCGCVETIDDDILERMSDLELLGGTAVAGGDGRPVSVHAMPGRSRAYIMSGGGAIRSALAIAFHDRCDMAGATAAIHGGQPLAHEKAVLEFLNGRLVRNWAEVTLGL